MTLLGPKSRRLVRSGYSSLGGLIWSGATYEGAPRLTTSPWLTVSFHCLRMRA